MKAKGLRKKNIILREANGRPKDLELGDSSSAKNHGGLRMTRVLLPFFLSFFFLATTSSTSWAEQPGEGEGGLCVDCNEGRPCNDGNICTDDACDVNTGNCTFTAVPGRACDDGKSCTINDVCQANGQCSGSLKPCDDPAPNDPCIDGKCDDTTGNCVATNTNVACNDGNLCTTGDNCVGGVCRGSPKGCDDQDACTENTCNLQTGQCEFKQPQGLNACSKTKPCADPLQCNPTLCTCQPPCPGAGNACTLNCPRGKCVIQNGQCRCQVPCGEVPKQTGELCDTAACPKNQICITATCTCIDCPIMGRCTLPPIPGAQCVIKTVGGVPRCEYRRRCSAGPLKEGETCNPDCPDCDVDTCTCEGICGDRIVQQALNEQCDDGNRVNGDGCNATCQFENCGNGQKEGQEICDDGNQVNCDGCSECRPDRCGDKRQCPNEQCDDGNNADNDGCSAQCRSEICGDNVVRGNEQCDDGNQVNGDGCNANCQFEKCGNGIVDQGEGCDDGNQVHCDGCSVCRPDKCGDGRQCPNAPQNELCDDGNNADNDGCSAQCLAERCGDNVVQANEQCDDGNQANGDGCNANCRFENCGNGVVDQGEGCDDGNQVNCDGCTNCQNDRCGDRRVCANAPLNEQCDDGNNADNDGCSAQCLAERCGDKIVQANEQCDDGNQVNGDGCNANCKFEKCGNGVVDQGEGCDDGNQVNCDGCSECRPDKCGDKRQCPNEQCDDGNNADNDGCSAQCRKEICGDKIVQANEQCDDGNQVNGDGCNANCQFEKCGNGVVDQGEGCDDGNKVNCDGCSGCRPDKCGDGRRCANAPQNEACDDGNNADNDGCSAQCLKEICGDKIVQANEQCDDGNQAACDGCTNCKTDRCGDRRVCANQNEQCDDGNNQAGDGCNANCQIEKCPNGVVDQGEQCDDGNQNNCDNCTVKCEPPKCGDKFVCAPEECDDGNNADGDGCSGKCIKEFCGDKIVQGRLGEQCDDGNQDNCDGCTTKCKLPKCGDNFKCPGEACEPPGVQDGCKAGETCNAKCACEAKPAQPGPGPGPGRPPFRPPRPGGGFPGGPGGGQPGGPGGAPLRPGGLQAGGGPFWDTDQPKSIIGRGTGGCPAWCLPDNNEPGTFNANTGFWECKNTGKVADADAQADLPMDERDPAACFTSRPAAQAAPTDYRCSGVRAQVAVIGDDGRCTCYKTAIPYTLNSCLPLPEFDQNGNVVPNVDPGRDKKPQPADQIGDDAKGGACWVVGDCKRWPKEKDVSESCWRPLMEGECKRTLGLWPPGRIVCEKAYCDIPKFVTDAVADKGNAAGLEWVLCNCPGCGDGILQRDEQCDPCTKLVCRGEHRNPDRLKRDCPEVGAQCNEGTCKCVAPAAAVQCPPDVMAPVDRALNNDPELRAAGEEERESWTEKASEWIFGKKAWASLDQSIQKAIDEKTPINYGFLIEGTDGQIRKTEKLMLGGGLADQGKIAAMIAKLKAELKCEETLRIVCGGKWCREEEMKGVLEISRKIQRALSYFGGAGVIIANLLDRLIRRYVDEWVRENCKDCNDVRRVQFNCCSGVKVTTPVQCDPGTPNKPPEQSVEEQCARMSDDCTGRNCSCTDQCQCLPPPKCEIAKLLTCKNQNKEIKLDNKISIPVTGVPRNINVEELCKKISSEDVNACCPKENGITPPFYEIKAVLDCQPGERCTQIPIKCTCPATCTYDIDFSGKCIQDQGTSSVTVNTTLRVFAKPKNESRCQQPVHMNITTNESGGRTSWGSIDVISTELPNPEYVEGNAASYSDWPVDRPVAVPFTFTPTSQIATSGSITARTQGAMGEANFLYVNMTRIQGKGELDLSGTGLRQVGECKIECQAQPQCYIPNAPLRLSKNVKLEDVTATFSGGGEFVLETTSDPKLQRCPYKCPEGESVRLSASTFTRVFRGKIPVEFSGQNRHCLNQNIAFACNFNQPISDEVVIEHFQQSKEQKVT